VKNHLTKRICVVIAISISIASCALFAESWFARGEWEYFAVCEDSYRPNIHMASNEITVWRDLGDGRVIVRSVARLVDTHKGATLPASPPEGAESSIRRWYEGDEAKSTQLSELARSIVGDAATVELAVERLCVWMRKNVSYSLGTSTDPLDVARNGRAYCEGYASLAVALFREAGIPAQYISGYIPPGNGWGFDDEGGGHAFVRYYYPGIGWLCVDPQSTNGFIDPFHLINFTGKYLAQYRGNANAYVTGYDSEPANWTTYMVAGDRGAESGKSVRRAIAVRAIADDGSGITPVNRLEKSGIALDPGHSFNGDSALGHGWQSCGDKNSVNIETDEKRVMARFPGSSWIAYFAPKIEWPISGEELLSSTNRAYFALARVKNAPEGMLKVDLDFGSSAAMHAMVRDPSSGKPAPGAKVEAAACGVSKTLTTDSRGYVHLLFIDPDGKPLDGETVTVYVGDQTRSLSYKGGQFVSLADAEARETALAAALERERSDAGVSRMTLVARDRTGVADSGIVSFASLFDGAREIRFTVRPEGYLTADGLTAGKAYSLHATVGGVNVIRKVGPIEEGKRADLEIRLSDLRPTRLTGPIPLEYSPPSLYLYDPECPGAVPWKLQPSDRRVLVDSGEAWLCVADNQNKANIDYVAPLPNGTREYNPATIDVRTLSATNGLFKWGTKSSVAYRVFRGGKPVRDALAYAIDRVDSSVTALVGCGNGTFIGKRLDPAREYTFAFAGSGTLILCAMPLDADGGSSQSFNLSDRGFPCGTGSGRYSSRGAPDSVKLLLPAKKEGMVRVESIPLRTGAQFMLFVDDGKYVISTDGSPMGAAILSERAVNGSSDDSWKSVAANPGGAAFLERSKTALRMLFPDPADLLCVSLKGSQEKGSAPTIALSVDGAQITPAFDGQGYLVLRMADAARGSFTYRKQGMYWTGGFSRSGAGPEILDLKPEAASCLRVSAAVNQYPKILSPAVKAGKFAIEEIPLTADTGWNVALYGPPGNVWLRWPDGYVQEGALPGAKLAVADRLKQNQSEAWLSFFKNADPNGAHWIVDMSARALSSEPTFRASDGKKPTVSSPVKGLYVLSGEGITSLDMCLAEKGSYRLERWSLDGVGPSRLDPAWQKKPSFTVSVKGKGKTPASAAVTLYEGGVLEGTTVRGCATRVPLVTSDKGNLSCYVPNGVWWVSAGGKFQKVTVKDSVGQSLLF